MNNEKNNSIRSIQLFAFREIIFTFAYPNEENLLEKIAFAKRPAREKTKFLIHREVKVKRSCYGVGVALLCELGFDSHWYEYSNCPTLFFMVYNLTEGRVKQTNLK